MAKNFENISNLVVGELFITQDQKKSYKIIMTGDELKFRNLSGNTDNFVISNDGSFTLPSVVSSTPDSPVTGGVVYVKSDGKLYFKNSSGTEYDMTDTGLDVSTLSDLGTAPASGDFIVIQDITDNSTKKVSVSNLTSTIDADITSVIAGSGLTGGASSGEATLNVGAGTGITVNADSIEIDSDGGTLTTSNSDVDHILINDGGVFKRITPGNINISSFNNDAGYTTETGDITGVTAGNGLSGGGTSGTVTLNVGGGTGINIAASGISVDVSDFMSNGGSNRVLTSTGTDTMTAESNLTFDGSTLTIDGAVDIGSNIIHNGTATNGFIDLDYDNSENNNSVAIGSLQSIYMFLDTNNSEATNQFGIYNNINNTDDPTDGDAIFLVAEDGDVTVTKDIDIAGNADIDGTLEADAITVNGATLSSVIAGTTVTNATNATSATTATNATNVATTTDSGNATHYITYVDSNTAGNQSLHTDSGITFNPSTNTLISHVVQATSEVKVFDGSTSSDTIVRMYDSNDDGIVDVYQNNSVKARIHGNGDSYFTGGDLGVGTSSPAAKLHVDRNATVGDIGGLTLGNATVKITDSGTSMYLDGNSINTEANTYFNVSTNNDLYFGTNNTERMRIRETGQILINTASVDTGEGILQIKQSADDEAGGGVTIFQSATDDAWTIWHSTGENLHFSYNGSSKGYLNDTGTYQQLNFTGQHRCSPSTEATFTNLSSSVGKIVVSDGTYSNPLGGGIQINDSIPRVNLSNTRNQKSVFGVISDAEDQDDDTRTYSHGIYTTVLNKSGSSDHRLHINSLGEGAIWVCNTNGALENGDYITTCEIPGYGMKQDDDILHNYTVAKITMDCMFDLSSGDYECVEIQHEGVTYLAAFVGCTYHCG